MNKFYSRSTKHEAPLYFQATVNGVRRQFCTGTHDPKEAEVQAMRLIVEAKTGMRMVMPEQPGVTTLQGIVNRYQAGAVEADEVTVKRNISSMNLILAASGLDLSAGPAVLTKQLILQFQASRRRLNQSVITINGVVRKARSIFCKACMPLYEDLGVTDATVAGFMRQPLLKEPKKSYTPPPEAAIDSLSREADGLKAEHPAMYAAFILAMYAGLRASEIVAAKWDWIKEVPGRCLIEIPSTVSKNGNTEPVAIDDKLVSELKAVRVDGNPSLVAAPRGKTPKDIVRTDLVQWLRGKGISSRCPNHELRKYFGSRVATESGIFVAQKQLRHSSPTLTNQYYAGLTQLPKPLAMR